MSKVLSLFEFPEENVSLFIAAYDSKSDKGVDHISRLYTSEEDIRQFRETLRTHNGTYIAGKFHTIFIDQNTTEHPESVLIRELTRWMAELSHTLCADFYDNRILFSLQMARILRESLPALRQHFPQFYEAETNTVADSAPQGTDAPASDSEA